MFYVVIGNIFILSGCAPDMSGFCGRDRQHLEISTDTGNPRGGGRSVSLVSQPQKMAVSAGALSFLLVWFAFLWLWSIPVVLIEYGVGRYTRKALIESWGALLGPSYRFLGAFPVVVSFCIA